MTGYFQDTQRVDEINLTNYIQFQAREGEASWTGEWVNGKVIELALLGDDMEEIGITVLTPYKKIHRIARKPSDTVSYSLYSMEEVEELEAAKKERANERARQALLHNARHVPADPTHDPR